MKLNDMAINTDHEFRKQLVKLLEGGEAHLDFASAVKDFPFAHTGAKPAGAPHSAWELLEHLRITQRDILDFSAGKDYKPLKWPDEYWPKEETPADEAAWKGSTNAFQGDLAAMTKLASDSENDLNSPLPHGKGQTLLREILLVADHNSHHLGQLLFLKKMLAAQA